MKKIPLLLLITVCIVQTTFSQSVAINNDASVANASAALDIKSTAKGMLIPRMTTTQRQAITSPATGLLVFDNTTGSFWFKSSSNWVELVDTANRQWKKSPNGTDIYRPYFSRVGINRTTPNYPLDVDGASFDNGITARFNNPTSTAGEKTTLLLHTGIQNGSQGAAAISSIASVSGGQHLTFTTVPSGVQTASNAFERMRIDSAGNVGIGTTTPKVKLDVNGSLSLSDKITTTTTGTANMIPFAFGKVKADGTVTAGTQNFTVYKNQTTNGSYNISFASGIVISQDNCVVIASVVDSYNALLNKIIAYKISLNSLAIYTSQLADRVHSTIDYDDFYERFDPANADFSFIVYKIN